MIFRTPEKDIEDYYLKLALNQSSLKVIISKGIQNFMQQSSDLLQDIYYEEKEHFVIGQGVDCVITRGKNIFDEKYYHSQIARKPSVTVMSILRMVYDKVRSEVELSKIKEAGEYGNLIYEACNVHGYAMNRLKDKWEDDTRMASILKPPAGNYWQDLITAGDRQILSDEEDDIIKKIINSITTHPFTAYLFEERRTIDVVYQFPMYFEIDKTPCKSLCDMIYIDHNNKRILPLDIKTTSFDILTFNVQIRSRRYDVQGSFYMTALAECIDQLGRVIDRDLTGYEIGNFAFIVESTMSPGTPLVFPLETSLLEIGENGDLTEGLLGWRQGLDKYNTWADKEFNINKMFEESNGVIFVNSDFEYNQIF